MSFPSVQLHTLPNADGSATYTFQGYTVVSCVNGPIEPQRRDEQPEETFLEVNLRPATGPGSPRDRLLETTLHDTLRALLVLQSHPRTLIQLTLQIVSSPESDPASAATAHGAASSAALAAASVLPCLPHLLHASLLALLAANIPLRTTVTAALVAGGAAGQGAGAGRAAAADDGGSVRDGAAEIMLWPGWDECRRASSVHVVAFTPTGECALLESEGTFGVDELEAAMDAAEDVCKGDAMEGGRGGLAGWLRGLMEEDIKSARRWKGEADSLR